MSVSRQHSASPARQADSGPAATSWEVFLLDLSSGIASFDVTPAGPGRISIVAYSISSRPLAAPLVLLINCNPPAVSKVQLAPLKAYRHVHDAISLTARVTDALGAPVSGAKLAFAVFGNCAPSADNAVKTTGADGTATVTLAASRPGVVSVVAASLDVTGTPMLLDHSHVFYYFSERHHAEERERQYFGQGDGCHRRPDEDRCVPTVLDCTGLDWAGTRGQVQQSCSCTLPKLIPVQQPLRARLWREALSCLRVPSDGDTEGGQSV